MFEGFFESFANGGVDLAAIASAAGLGGGVVSTLAAVAFFKGVILRVITQLILTTVLTGVGFLVLLNVLGFEIVPREVAAVPPSASEPGVFSTQSAPSESADAAPAGERTFYMKSPFRRS